MVIKSNSASSNFRPILKLNSKINIIFICLGNACRSQMAEAFANHYGDKWVNAWSAGSVPLGRIAEGTETIMSEIGISLAGHYSKGFNEVPIEKMAWIVIMGCGIQCPVAPDFRGQLVEWDILDPFGCSLEHFREVRDLVKCKVRDLLRSVCALPSDC